jgi:arginase
VHGPLDVQLSAEEENSYGAWNRVATANSHLAATVAAAHSDNTLVLGLLADCNSVLGMLGGLVRSQEPSWPRRVGLIWIDAHADYNTPETSPSGMLGGMPVAVACGKCLSRLRRQSQLRVPLQQPDVLMVGLRYVDPLEQEAIENDGIVTVGANDLVDNSERLRWAMNHLSAREDILYVHVDLDILDPEAAPAAGLPTPGGITGRELGQGLRHLLRNPKVAALAAVSYRPDDDITGKTLEQVKKAILGGTKGLAERQGDRER